MLISFNSRKNSTHLNEVFFAITKLLFVVLVVVEHVTVCHFKVAKVFLLTP